jgi:hypothetical protein
VSRAQKAATAVDGEQIAELLDEYLRLLGSPGQGPEVEIRDNLGSKWLGRTVLTSRTGQIKIEIQASVLSHLETLERVLAHEVVHYVELSTLSDNDFALLRNDIYPEHGKRFKELAGVVNDAKGADFVTITSDEDYEVAPNEREFLLLVSEAYGGKLGWAWAQRPSKAGQAFIDRSVERGAILVQTTDERFTRGARIGKGKIGMSVPREGSEVEAELKEIWNKARGR